MERSQAILNQDITACGSVCPSPSDHFLHVKAGFAEQFTDFFFKIGDTSDWPARWHCGNWTDFHGWLYIFSDLLIWASYFAIPVLLFRLISKRKDLPFTRIFWLFAAFIILCGTTHLLDAAIFWWPAYRLSALVRFITGVVSIFTVFALYKILPLILSLRSVEELEREIKERKAVEEKLAASEFLLSEAGRITRVGGWEYDLVTGKSTWSNAVYAIFGLAKDYDIDKGDIFGFFTEPYKEQLIHSVDQARLNGTGWDLELQMLTANNKPIWVRTICSALLDDKRQVIKLRGVFMDINDYKMNEIALQNSMELLTRQNHQLKSFTHILSHNIRNHASNMTLLTSFVDTSVLDPDNAELFQNISKVSIALNSTLEDLSEAIKIRESPVKAEPLSFAQITQNVLEVLNADLAANQGQLNTAFEVEEIIYPKIYLESIILNLVSNGIKYRKEDTPPIISLRTYRDEQGRTIMEYADNGIGINLKLHGDKLFGLYKTFHARKDAHGVGLFLVKNQVEAMGGEIQVISKPEEGATFKILFHEKN